MQRKWKLFIICLILRRDYEKPKTKFRLSTLLSYVRMACALLSLVIAIGEF